MKERIAQIMQNENMTAIQFAKKIGINPSSLSHILSGRNNTSLDIIMKIHKSCSYINLNWLLYGEGVMKDANSSESPSLTLDFADDTLEFAPNDRSIPENRKENGGNSGENPVKEIVRQEIKYIEKPSRKITEIRIFFDNGTYETFRPSSES